MKFLVDQSLGGLLKWLRLLGYDAEPTGLNSRQPGALPAPQPETCILTRQAGLAANLRRPDLVVLAADEVEEQVAELCRRLHLPPQAWRPLHRCSKCNHLLQSVGPEQVADKVPDYILGRYSQFAVCPQCQRVFWEGSHQTRIRQRLQALEHQIEPP